MKLIFFNVAAVLLAVALAENLNEDVKLTKIRDSSSTCEKRKYTNPRGVVSKGQEYFDVFTDRICVHTIQLAPSKKIQLNLDTFFSELSTNYITIYDGNPSDGTILANCTEENKATYLNVDIISTKNIMTIVSNAATSASTFSWHSSYLTLSENTNLSQKANSGQITSANFDTHYDNSENQINVIEADSNLVITLTFDVLQIPTDEYTLFVYDGPDRHSPKLLSLSGQKTSSPIIVTSITSVVSIYFIPLITDVKYKAWKISWNAHAGPTSTLPSANNCPPSTYDSNYGTLTSTNYPHNYLNDLNCVYLITAPVGQRVFFSLNDLSTESCCDYLKVYDGIGVFSPLVREYQGELKNQAASTHVISTSNSLYLYFATDHNTVGRGWSATYQIYEDLISTVSTVNYINGTSGTISTSDIPQNYGKNVDYSYIIRVPMYFKVNFQIKSYALSQTALTIYDGPLEQSHILGTLTGTAVSSLKYSSTFNYISLNIKGFIGNRDNIQLDLTWKTEKLTGFCGTSAFTEAKGIIASPGYDGNYPNNLNCMVKITLPENKRILVTMDSFITEQDNDYLEIYDGDSINSPLIGHYTGDLTSHLSLMSFSSYSNVVTLVFFSDLAINAQGWQLHYETIDVDATLTTYAIEGQITSKNYPKNYDVHTTEIYSIKNSYDHPITFSVNSLSLAPGSSLVFYDGIGKNGHIFGNLTGSKSTPTLLTSQNSEVLVYFVAQTTAVDKGFSFTWTTQNGDPTCPRQIYASQFGQLTSPNYPSNYTNNQDCYYYIQVPIGKRIEFDMVAFNTEPNNDYLAIFDGPDTTGTPFITNQGSIQNSSPSAQIKSSSNALTLWFHSDKANTATGFSGFYTEFDATNIIKLESSAGELTSKNYPSNYNMYAEEHYLIFSPEKQTINITLNDISLQKSYTTLSLYDGPSESYPVLASYSGHVQINLNNGTLISTQNMITVVFKSEFPISDRGFNLTWAS
uniref:CUBN n=1 Tax=Rhabditophanes sp. KR3021 TaxID=114890 RepID=A0AC35TWS1_9BILA